MRIVGVVCSGSHSGGAIYGRGGDDGVSGAPAPEHGRTHVGKQRITGVIGGRHEPRKADGRREPCRCQPQQLQRDRAALRESDQTHGRRLDGIEPPKYGGCRGIHPDRIGGAGVSPASDHHANPPLSDIGARTDATVAANGSRGDNPNRSPSWEP